MYQILLRIKQKKNQFNFDMIWIISFLQVKNMAYTLSRLVIYMSYFTHIYIYIVLFF